MEEIDALQTIFDRMTACFRCHHQSCEVVETAAGAQFRKLEIRSAGTDFHEIGNAFYKGIKNTTQDRSTHLKDLDCDGVSLFVDAEGRKHIVLVDLKSNFDIQKICGAYEQDIHTFLKLHALFSLCEGYFLRGMVIDLIVACKTFKDTDQETRVLDIISMKCMEEEDSFEKKFLNSLLHDGPVKTCRMDDLNTIRSLPFHPSIKGVDVRLHLFTTIRYTDTEGIYNL